jgi:predicted amidohydrolase YtcJ
MALTKGLGDDMLRISGTKLFADGSLGGRTAALYEPYEKEPTNTGIVVSTDEEILLATRASQKLGIPMVIHAIGDRAVGSVLRAYHECHLEREADGWERLPHRIEHLQLLHPQDADLLATVRPVASVQPVHLCADIDAILEHWGSRRLHGAYAFRTIREAGCPLIFGSDAPVEPISPWLGLYGAVTRSDLEGRHPDGVVRSERLTVPECLEAYTAGPARAVGQWPRVGSLLVGAYADFAIYGEDPSMESPESWKSTRALATFVGGKCVWTGAGQEYYWEASQGTRK